MGKGDKKTKRGKIVIGSSGVRRAKKKRSTAPAATTKAEPKQKAEVDELEIAAPKAAAKKTSKKVEGSEGSDDKAKTSKTKKKGDSEELPAEEPKQE